MYLLLKAGLLANSRKASKRKRAGGGKPNSRDGQVSAISASIKLMFLKWKHEWGAGWDTAKASKLAAVLASLIVSVSIGDLRATPRQFVRCFMPVFCFTLVIKQTMLAVPYNIQDVLILSRMTNNQTLFAVWVLKLSPGIGNILSNDCFRREMMAAMDEQERSKKTRTTASAEGSVWQEAIRSAYAMDDRHGEFVWSQKHEVTDERLVVHKTTSGAFLVDLVAYKDGSVLAHVVTAADECASMPAALAKVYRRFTLVYLACKSAMKMAKAGNKLLGRVKSEVANAMVPHVSCIELQTTSPELLWTQLSGQELQPLFPGDKPSPGDVVGNTLGPYTYLRAAVGGGDTIEMKRRRSGYKAKDALRVRAMPANKQFRTLAWRCLHQRTTIPVETSDGAHLPNMQIEQSFPCIHHDAQFQRYWRRCLEFKASVLLEDYNCVVAACESKGCAMPSRSSEWYKVIQKTKACLPGALCLEELHRAFDQLHTWVNKRSALCWKTVFGAREVKVDTLQPTQAGEYILLCYNNPARACEVFDRMRLDCDEPSYNESPQQSNKVLDIWGYTWTIKERYPNGSTVSPFAPSCKVGDTVCRKRTPECKLCKQPNTTPVFVPMEGTVVCMHCMFGKLGSFETGGPSGVCENAGDDQLHGSMPPHTVFLNSARFYVTGNKSAAATSALDYGNDGPLIVHRPFKAPCFLGGYKYQASGRYVCSSALHPASTRVDEGEYMGAYRIVSAESSSVTIDVTKYPPRDYSGADCGVPSWTAVETFYAWLTVDGKMKEYESLVCSGPHGEMTESKLCFAFRLWMAFVERRELPFIGACSAYLDSHVREQTNSAALDMMMSSESDDSESDMWEVDLEKELLSINPNAILDSI
jgi:hypothetical protein